MEERLQKLMARAGLGSRRDNEKLIAAGRVRLNGRVAQLGDKADPHRDTLELDGKDINIADYFRVYIKLYKPRGVISSLEDELDQNRPVVRDLLPQHGHIYPVGRLDKQSEGLMLMTNDGQLAHRLTHPRFAHDKMYVVTVEGKIGANELRQWREGVMLDDRLTAPADIEILAQSRKETKLQITLREGRKRQIRRISAEFGHPVMQLKRVRIASLELDDLQPGEWRYLTDSEIEQLRAYAKPNETDGERRTG